MPSADFYAAIGPPYDAPQSRKTTTQISRGKLNRLRCTPAGSTTQGLDGYGLRCLKAARPPCTA